MEARTGDIAENEKLYNNAATKHLQNGIHYIVPDGAMERSMSKVYDDFMAAKTPYTEIEFFRELEKIGNGFLPSNLLLQRLEKTRTELERQRPTSSPSVRGVLDAIKRIGIRTADIPAITPSQRIGLGNMLTFSFEEIKAGNYQSGLDALGGIRDETKTLL
jgi:hypothetical protein